MTMGFRRRGYTKRADVFLALIEHATGERFFFNQKKAIARMDAMMTGDRWGSWGAALTTQAVLDGKSYEWASCHVGAISGISFAPDALDDARFEWMRRRTSVRPVPWNLIGVIG